MKEKIIARIKALYPGINLSKKRLDAIADKIEKKVGDDETQVDAQITSFNDYNPLADIAKEDDTLRNLNKQVKDLTATAKPAATPVAGQNATTEDVDDGTPAWAKTIIESNKTLLAEVNVLKGEKLATSMRSTLAEKLKDVPESFWGERVLPTDTEQVDAFVTKATADWGAISKGFTDQGMKFMASGGKGGSAAAAGGSGGTGGSGGDGKVDPAIAALGKTISGKSGMGISISGPVPVNQPQTAVNVVAK